MEKKNYANALTAYFGGVSAMARTIDVPLTTVRDWIRRGSIPTKYHDRLFDVSKRVVTDDLISLDVLRKRSPNAYARRINRMAKTERGAMLAKQWGELE